MTEQAPPRSVCPTAHLPLFARVGSDGSVLSVSNSHVPDDERATTATWRDLPLFGENTPFDLVTEVREGPSYAVEANRVIRSYTVRPKLAAELLHEISWWFAALHSSGAAQVSPTFKGMSPSEVNDSARTMMVAAAAVGQSR